MTTLALEIDFETARIQDMDELMSFRFTDPQTRKQAIMSYLKNTRTKDDLDPLPYLTQDFSGNDMADLSLELATLVLRKTKNDHLQEELLEKFIQILPVLLRGLTSLHKKSEFLNNRKSGKLLEILINETDTISDEAVQEIICALLDS